MEANRVPAQMAIEVIPNLDRTIDTISVVWGRDLVGLHINSSGEIIVFPESGLFERVTTGLLVGNERKFDYVAEKYSSKELSAISKFYDIAEAGYSIAGAYKKMDFSRAWREMQSGPSGETKSMNE